MVSETLELIIRTSGTSSAASQITSISSSARSATASVNSLNASLAFMRKTLVALSFIRVFEGVAESISKTQQINNQLIQISKNAADVPKAFAMFSQIAIATHAPLDAVVGLGVQIARSSASYKMSAKDIGAAVQTIFNTFRLSGSDPTTIKNVTKDLKEIFSLGTVQGRQFRAVILQDQAEALVLAKYIQSTGANAATVNKQLAAARQGGKLPDIYEFAMKNKGAFTGGDVLRANIAATQDIQNKVAKLPVTLGQAFTDLQTKWLGFLNTLNNSGAFQPIVNFVEFLANNLPTIAEFALAAGAAFASWAIITRIAPVISFMLTPIGAVTAALVGLGLVIAALFGEKLNAAAQSVGGWGEYLIRIMAQTAAIIQTIFQNLWATIANAFLVVINGAIAGINFLSAKLDTILPKTAQLGQIAQVANPYAAQLQGAFRKNLATDYSALEGAFKPKNPGAPSNFVPPAPPADQTEVTKDRAAKMREALQGLEDAVSKFAGPAVKLQDDLDKMSTKIKDLTTATHNAKGEVVPALLSMSQVMDVFTKAGFKGNTFQDQFKQYTQATERSLLGLKNTSLEFSQTQELVNKALKDGAIDQAQANKLIDDAKKKRDLYNLSLLDTVDAAVATAKLKVDQGDHAARSKAGAEAVATSALQAMNKTDVDTYNKSLQALQKLYKDDDISADVFAQELLKLQEGMLTGTDAMTGYQKGLLEVQKSMFDVSGTAAKAMTDAFNGLENVLVKFSMTGKFNIHDMAQSILTDLDTLAVKQAIMQPLLSFMNLAPGQNTAAGGTGGGFLGNLFGSIFGSQAGGMGGNLGGSAATPVWVTITSSAGDIFGGLGPSGGGTGAGSSPLSTLFGGGSGSSPTASGGMFSSGGLLGSGGFFDNLFSGTGGGAGSASSGILSTLGSIGSLFGFASGGSFQVGGMGGTDSQVVAFRASPDETVSVQTPQQQRAAQKAQTTQSMQGGIHVHLHGVTDMDSFKKSKTQLTSGIGQAISRSMRRQGA